MPYESYKHKVIRILNEEHRIPKNGIIGEFDFDRIAKEKLYVVFFDYNHKNVVLAKSLDEFTAWKKAYENLSNNQDYKGKILFK